MKAAEHHNGSQTENTTPTISGYYSDGELKPAQFFKLVQASQIKVFRSDDVELALNNLTERDKDLTRTMSLASAAKVPEAVELWVAEAARMSIRSVVPEIAIEDSAEANFKRLTRELASDLRGKDKPKRRRAENLIRLALIWLIGRRSLDPMSALKALSEAKGTMSTPKVLRSNAQKLLMRSYNKTSQWRSLSIIVDLCSTAVLEAERLRDEAIRNVSSLDVRISELEEMVSAERQNRENLEADVARLEGELQKALDDASQQRHLRELDLAEWATQSRAFLSGRLSLLLSDARNALDFEPPHIEAVRQRVTAAQETIAQEMDRLNA